MKLHEVAPIHLNNLSKQESAFLEVRRTFRSEPMYRVNIVSSQAVDAKRFGEGELEALDPIREFACDTENDFVANWLDGKETRDATYAFLRMALDPKGLTLGCEGEYERQHITMVVNFLRHETSSDLNIVVTDAPDLILKNDRKVDRESDRYKKWSSQDHRETEESQEIVR